ncbi:hypothetical protein D3C80_1916700 [compost metagenome]
MFPAYEIARRLGELLQAQRLGEQLRDEQSQVCGIVTAQVVPAIFHIEPTHTLAGGNHR